MARTDFVATATPSGALPEVTIKRLPTDWRVHEVLDMPLSGRGEHAYFLVEKTSLNTSDVVHELARAYAVTPREVGYCGLKDKHAVTSQWFSVPTPTDAWRVDVPGLRCLDVRRHERKLRRGQHAANAFEIMLRPALATQEVESHCAGLNAPFANYFGIQRVAQDHIDEAKAWLNRRRQQQRSRHRRGFHLSVLRSYLFNEVLSARVARVNFATLIDGDVAHDGMPTGPLWGRGRSATASAALAIERAALERHEALRHELEFAGVQQGRRVMAVTPAKLAFAPSEGGWLVAFRLPPGSYATTLLQTTFSVKDASRP